MAVPVLSKGGVVTKINSNSWKVILFDNKRLQISKQTNCLKPIIVNRNFFKHDFTTSSLAGKHQSKLFHLR